jgi:hypothetical protein
MKLLRLGVVGAGSQAVASHLPNFAQRWFNAEPHIFNRIGWNSYETTRAQTVANVRVAEDAEMA